MADQRSPISYLLLPRCHETWVKLSLVPAAYGLVHLGDATGSVAVGAALVAWLVFELGLYQTRYMLNDLADMEVDRAHVVAGWARAPGVPGMRRRMVRAVVVRATLSLTVMLLLPGKTRAITLAAALALVASTVGYELARTAIRRRPLADWETARLTAREAAVFGLVGSGYALRVGFGVALAGVTGPLVVAAAGFGWAYGVLTVLMAWTIEAAGLRAGRADTVLARKSHIAVLARLVEDDRARLDRPLLAGRPAPLVGYLFIGAWLPAMVLGVGLAGSPGPARVGLLLVVTVLTGPLLLVRWASPWAGAAMVAAHAAAVGLLAGTGHPELVALLITVSGVTAVLRATSLTALDLGHLLPPPDYALTNVWPR